MTQRMFQRNSLFLPPNQYRHKKKTNDQSSGRDANRRNVCDRSRQNSGSTKNDASYHSQSKALYFFIMLVVFAHKRMSSRYPRFCCAFSQRGKPSLNDIALLDRIVKNSFIVMKIMLLSRVSFSTEFEQKKVPNYEIS